MTTFPTDSPFLYKRDRDQEEERWAGRYIIDFAYSLGCLSVLGDDGALERLKSVGWSESRKVKRALLDQYRRGMQDERRRGPLLETTP